MENQTFEHFTRSTKPLLIIDAQWARILFHINFFFQSQFKLASPFQMNLKSKQGCKLESDYFRYVNHQQTIITSDNLSIDFLCKFFNQILKFFFDNTFPFLETSYLCSELWSDSVRDVQSWNWYLMIQYDMGLMDWAYSRLFFCLASLKQSNEIFQIPNVFKINQNSFSFWLI